jgi:hypothetical protein
MSEVTTVALVTLLAIAGLLAISLVVAIAFGDDETMSDEVDVKEFEDWKRLR